MSLLAAICPNVQGFVSEHGKGYQIRARCCFARHEQSCLSGILAYGLLDKHSNGGWRSGIDVTVPLPTRGPEVWLQPRIRCANTAPQIFFKSQAPKRSQGSAGSFPAGSDPTLLLP